MIIIFNMPENSWNYEKNFGFIGKELIKKDSFLHCSTAAQFPLIIKRLVESDNEYVVLLINTDKLKAELKWEHSKKYNQDFPHIYGLINIDAVEESIPLKDYIAKYITDTSI